MFWNIFLICPILPYREILKNKYRRVEIFCNSKERTCSLMNIISFAQDYFQFYPEYHRTRAMIHGVNTCSIITRLGEKILTKSLTMLCHGRVEDQKDCALHTSLLDTLLEILPLMRCWQSVCALTALKMVIPEARWIFAWKWEAKPLLSFSAFFWKLFFI